MEQSQPWEPLAAACVVDMVKKADLQGEDLVLIHPVVERLHRLLEDPDYRAVAMDTWAEFFVKDGQPATLDSVIADYRRTKQIE